MASQFRFLHSTLASCNFFSGFYAQAFDFIRMFFFYHLQFSPDILAFALLSVNCISPEGCGGMTVLGLLSTMDDVKCLGRLKLLGLVR